MRDNVTHGRIAYTKIVSTILQQRRHLLISNVHFQLGYPPGSACRMPPFTGNRPWKLGACDWKLSPDCTYNAKKGSVMCVYCLKAATPQEQENCKQAHAGAYCSQFGCWETCDGRKFGWCSNHGPGATSCSSSSPGATTPHLALLRQRADHSVQPPSSTMLQQLIADADAAELGRIIMAATERLERLASAVSPWITKMY